MYELTIMPRKIFISYRREDTAANALGIGQYLEHQFGRKNVFIDVDMRAGAKFPAVLEQRLAECKVMLVLIGHGWLNASDDQGRRRLNHSDDWVRLEIAAALKRNITVIPVRVNGTELPPRHALPEDIQGLLDHQAVSVTTTGFRNEMAGLARDIRALPSGPRWLLVAAIAATVLIMLSAAFAVTQKSNLFGLANKNDHAELPSEQETIHDKAPAVDALWSAKPGEWVMFAADSKPAAYYFQPNSVKMFDDKVVYIARSPLKLNGTPEPASQTAVYEDDETVISCGKGLWAQAEFSFYNKAGEVISHFKRGDPDSLDLSAVGQPINSGSILAIARHLLCDKELRNPLLSKRDFTDNINKLSYLAPTVGGDGDMLYGPSTPIANSTNLFGTMVATKFYRDQPLTNVFPGQSVLGLPPPYRVVASSLILDCTLKKVQFPKTEYFDAGGNLLYVFAPLALEAIDAKPISPLSLRLDLACAGSSPNVEGTYEGTNKASYTGGGEGEQKISIDVTQRGSDVIISFRTPTGGAGKGSGKLVGNTVDSLTLQSTAPGCPGSYTGSAKFDGNSMTWSYKGTDCGGSMEGHGTASRTRA